MTSNLCLTLILVGSILLFTANQRVTIHLRGIPVIGQVIEKVSFPLGTGLFAVGLILLFYGYCG